MARFIGAKTKIARRFKEPIFGPDKNFEKRNYPPGQHGQARKRAKLTEYAIQLYEKQKAKYTYGLLERQFYKTFEEAARKKGVTGENLMKYLEARLDNTVFRLGFAGTRDQARQLVSHRHITVNGKVVNIASYSLKPGDVVGIREKSKSLEVINDSLAISNAKKYNWLTLDEKEMQGTFVAYPEREVIPENIKEQLIVELYSK
ncbi:MAG: 30S ribosomal protein S4 [Bacteroidia bacterium]|jgi:small subunit ribosomal protein S4|nr:30S ribosomal protein S4 [Bacteroidia bacterium]